MEFTKDTIEIEELEVFWKELFEARGIKSFTSAQFEIHIQPFRKKLEQIKSNVKYLRGDGIVTDVRIDRHENPRVKWEDYSHLVSISITYDSFLINTFSGSNYEKRLKISYCKNMYKSDPNTEIEVQKALQIKKGSINQFYGIIGGNWWGIDDRQVQIGDITGFISLHDINSVPMKNLEELEDEAKQNRKGLCFIATAAYGNPDSLEVMTLRTYRDNVLQTTYGGKLLIKLYYFVSPPIAKIISRNEHLKRGTRFIIRSYILPKIKKRKTHIIG